MGNNLIDVSFSYLKGQGHSSQICVILNMLKFIEKRMDEYFLIKLGTMIDR
jgi:hypothetical protein